MLVETLLRRAALLLSVGTLALSACAPVTPDDDPSEDADEDDSALSSVVQAGTSLRVTASALNLRKNANTSSQVLDVIDNGTVIVCTQTSGGNGWVRVQFGAKQGWVSRQYVEVVEDDEGLAGVAAHVGERLGEGRRSRVLLNDAVLIEDLRESQDLFAELHALGDEAAAHFEEHLPAALARSERVIVAIHAPPFREACWHEGRISDDDWLPHFTCHAAGQVLERTMRAHRDKQMTVVCGHTHSGGHARILSNLEVRTGAADYERPEVQTTLVIE